MVDAIKTKTLDQVSEELDRIVRSGTLGEVLFETHFKGVRRWHHQVRREAPIGGVPG